jgi:hypothetical protein
MSTRAKTVTRIGGGDRFRTEDAAMPALKNIREEMSRGLRLSVRIPLRMLKRWLRKFLKRMKEDLGNG